jgi:tetratricopeptide (TPR) repeat protein
MLDQVEPRLRKALPPGHYAFSALTSERSLISQQQGDSRRALELANAAIALNEEFSKHGKTGAQYLPNLLWHRASMETDCGQLVPAEHDARQALALLQAAAQPGDFSTSTGHAYLALARTLSAQGRRTEAREAALRATDQLEKAVGPGHPDTRAAKELASAAD